MKTLIATAIALTISLPALAQDTKSQEFSLHTMPEEVKSSIEELRQYGDRFEKVIEAIEAEWAKPMWAEGVECQDASETSRNAGS